MSDKPEEIGGKPEDIAVNAAAPGGETIELVNVVLGFEPYVLLRWMLDASNEPVLKVNAGGGWKSREDMRDTLQAAIEGLRDE